MGAQGRVGLAQHGQVVAAMVVVARMQGRGGGHGGVRPAAWHAGSHAAIGHQQRCIAHAVAMTSRLCHAWTQLAIVHALTVLPRASPRQRPPCERDHCSCCLSQLPAPAARRVLPTLRPGRAQPAQIPGACHRGCVRVVLAPGRADLPHPLRAMDSRPHRQQLPGRPARAYLPPLRLFVVLSLFAFFAARLALTGRRNCWTSARAMACSPRWTTWPR